MNSTEINDPTTSVHLLLSRKFQRILGTIYNFADIYINIKNKSLIYKNWTVNRRKRCKGRNDDMKKNKIRIILYKLYLTLKKNNNKL